MLHCRLPVICHALYSLGLSATSQQYFSLRTNQPPAISQQYFSLRINQHQPSATSQTNRLQINDILLAVVLYNIFSSEKVRKPYAQLYQEIRFFFFCKGSLCLDDTFLCSHGGRDGRRWRQRGVTGEDI
jgi:hypothetical protein